MHSVIQVCQKIMFNLSSKNNVMPWCINLHPYRNVPCPFKNYKVKHFLLKKICMNKTVASTPMRTNNTMFHKVTLLSYTWVHFSCRTECSGDALEFGELFMSFSLTIELFTLQNLLSGDPVNCDKKHHMGLIIHDTMNKWCIANQKKHARQRYRNDSYTIIALRQWIPILNANTQKIYSIDISWRLWRGSMAFLSFTALQIMVQQHLKASSTALHEW